MKHYLITAIIMALSLVPSIARAQYFSAVNDDGVTINYYIISEEEKTCKVVPLFDDNGIYPYNNEETNIPESANGYKVVSISEDAFSCGSKTKRVTIPNTVISIEDNAFSNCTELTSVTIGNSVTTIGDAAFYGCYGLKSITIGNSVTTIGESAFNGCGDLTSITIPNSVTSIGGEAFASCGITSLTIPSSVTSIGNNAFADCWALTSVTIQNADIDFGMGVFYRSDNITYLEIHYANVQSEFEDLKSIQTLVIGDEVETIGESAFQDCTELESVTFGKSLKVIGNVAFCNCTNLKSVTFSNSPAAIGAAAFYGCKNLESLSLGSSIVSIGDFSFEDCQKLKSITIPDQVEDIGYGAFSDCISLESVTFGSSVKNIGKEAFSECTSITTMDIPSSVENIGQYAFRDCTGLEYVNTENGLRSIDYGAFSGCVNLKTLILGNSVETIYSEAFKGCESLQSLTIPKSVKSIANDAFSPSFLESIIVEEGNETYNSYGNCNAIIHTSTNTIILGCKNTVFPASVTSIGASAFYGCSGIISLTISASITSIGASAFANCTNLSTIYSEITDFFDIDKSVFKGSENTTLYVPKGMATTYRSSTGWSVIKYIEEMPDDTPDASFLISCSGKGSVSVNGLPSIANKIAAADINEGNVNTFTFTPKPNCRLDQVTLNGLDITANVEGNTLTCTIPANSQMIVTFTSEQGDMNKDGTLDISDVVAIVNKILGN